MGIEYDFSWWVWKCGSLYPVLLHIATMNCHECLNFHGKLMMASLYAKIMAALGAPWAPHFQQSIWGTNCKRIPGEKNEQNSQIHWESWTHWENWQGVLQKLKVELHQLGFNQHYSAYRRDDMQVFTRIRLQIGEGPSLSWPLCMGKMKINQYCFGFQMVKTWDFALTRQVSICNSILTGKRSDVDATTCDIEPAGTVHVPSWIMDGKHLLVGCLEHVPIIYEIIPIDFHIFQDG